MSKFAIKKKVELAFLGEEWKDAYIILTPLAVREFERIQKLAPKDETDVDANLAAMNQMLEIIKEHFVSGKGWDGEALVTIEKDDIIELPMDILTVCISSLAGKSDPKL